eukprot:COSAG06_NODE_9222_length_1954_cov_25.731536_3_plen_28_part_01
MADKVRSMPAWRGYISLPEGESEDPSVK